LKVILHPTQRQLKTLKGVVYAIINRVTGKWYIGYTRNTFWYRYSGNWSKTTCNQYLKASCAKHGIKAFEIMILDHGIEDTERLKALEASFASFFDTYIPNGYNLAPCGVGAGICTDELRSLRSKAASKEYRFRDITNWEIITVKGLKLFAETLGCSIDHLRKVFNTRLGFVAANRYCHIDATRDDIANYKPRTTESRSKPYDMYYDGKKIHIPNLSAYCRENKLSVAYMKKVVSGKQPYYKGYTMNQETRRFESKIRYHVILSKDGREIDVSNIQSFCRDNSLRDGPIYGLLTGKYKTAYGYSLVKVIKS
jgi:predicted GIY-YIG superfamily endonuclease